jgi:hypothetical protein
LTLLYVICILDVQLYLELFVYNERSELDTFHLDQGSGHPVRAPGAEYQGTSIMYQPALPGI